MKVFVIAACREKEGEKAYFDFNGFFMGEKVRKICALNGGGHQVQCIYKLLVLVYSLEKEVLHVKILKSEKLWRL